MSTTPARSSGPRAAPRRHLSALATNTQKICGLGLLLLALAGNAARAFYPVDGWWWNGNEPGRGFNIEMQDDVMFISGFIYDDARQPIWFTSSGRYDALTSRLVASADLSTGGQCIGCPYTPPTTTVGALGPITLQFTSAVTATLSWAGGSLPLTRFYWAFGEPLDFLYGRFGMVMSIGLNGDRVDLRSPFTASDGTRYVSGNRTGSSGSNNAALAQFRDGSFFLLLDSTTSFYRFWQFDLTKDRWEGRFWLFEKDELPTGAGSPFHGFRIASRSFVQTGIGPTAGDQDKHAVAPPSDSQERALQAQLKAQDTTPPRNHHGTHTETQAQADRNVTFMRLQALLQQHQNHLKQPADPARQ